MKDNEQGQGFGNSLPGTGGDFIDGNDVEGHIKTNRDAEGDSFGGRNPRMPLNDGADGFGGRNPRIPLNDGGVEDTEGHTVTGQGGEDFGGRNPRMPLNDGAEGFGGRNPRMPLNDGSGEDVEGHRVHAVPEDGDGIYTRSGSGGEIVMRGPDDNPHGER